MNLKSYFIFLFLLTGSIIGQNISLKGKVTDSKTGEPVEGAVVFISYVNMAYTNKDGDYVIKDLQPGNYILKVSQVGYKAISDKITLQANAEKNISLESSPIELDEVIVSTNRFDKYLRNSPYSELLVNQKSLESKPYESLPDVLKEEPGISLISEGAWGTEVSIRGLSRENVVALIDGNRIATSTDVAARFSLIDINDIDRVEIIKGASSSIYGSGATGGIVNIVTKSPAFSDEFAVTGNVTTGFNSVNNMSVTSGSLSGGNKLWSSKISGSYRKAGNIRTPIGEIKNSQFEDYGFSGNFNLKPTDNHLLKLNYQLFKAENVGIPGSDVFPATADIRYPFEKRALISAGYEIQNISRLFYKLSVNYSNQVINRDVENIPHIVQNVAATSTSPAKRVSVLKITPAADHKNNNLQVKGNFLLPGNNNLAAGIDYWDRSYNGHREKYQLIETLNSAGDVVGTVNKIIEESPLPNSKYKSLGVYAQDDVDLMKNKWTVSIGARADQINVTGGKTYNPVYDITNGVINYSPAGQQVIWDNIEANDVSYSANFGTKYSVSENLDATLSLGLAFRSPSLEERFQYIDQGSYVRLGNPNLKSERSKSADLGIRYYQHDLKIVTSVFYNYFNDLVAELPGTFEGRQAYIKTNIGEAKLYGFDFQADYNFYGETVAYVKASYVKGDDITSSGNLPQIPPLNGICGIRFRLLDMISADVSSTIFAAQNDVAAGEMTTPGYATFNIEFSTGHFNTGMINFSFTGGIQNLFDKNYRDHLSTTRGNITIEPGRNFYLKMIANF